MGKREHTRSRRDESAARTRPRIVEVATTAFGSDGGYQRTGIDQVAAAADVSRGSVYHHFGGKVGMFAAALEARWAQVLVQCTPHFSGRGVQACSMIVAAGRGDETLRALLRQSAFVLGERRRGQILSASLPGVLADIPSEQLADGLNPEAVSEVLVPLVVTAIVDGSEPARVVAEQMVAGLAAAR